MLADAVSGIEYQASGISGQEIKKAQEAFCG
jgi:hypothetical protein